MVLESLVVAVEVVLMAVTTLAMEATSVVLVALVPAKMVAVMMAVGMDTMDLVMMEVILELVRIMIFFTITAINLQILDPWREKMLEAEALTLTMMVAIILPNHKIKVVMEVAASTITMAAEKVFMTARAQNLAG